MPSIKVLDLSHNELEFPDIPEELDTLEVLNLSYNCIRHLCISKTMLKSLRDLSVGSLWLIQRTTLWKMLISHSDCSSWRALLLPIASWHLLTSHYVQLLDWKASVCVIPCHNLEHNKLSSLRLPNNLTVLEELCIQNNNISILELSNIDLPELRVLDICSYTLIQLITTSPNWHSQITSTSCKSWTFLGIGCQH